MPIILIFFLFFCSCSGYQWLDVTGHNKFKEYSYLVGSRYITCADLEIIGIRTDYPRKMTIDRYALMPARRPGGPEYEFIKILRSGSIIEIEKIFKTIPIDNKGKGIEYGVKILNDFSLKKNIHIYRHPKNNFYTKSGTGLSILNPEYFKLQ